MTIIQNGFLEDKIPESTLTAHEINPCNLVKIYPNPNNGDVINMEFFNEGLTNDIQMKILDINGRIMESRKINTEAGLNKKSSF